MNSILKCSLVSLGVLLGLTSAIISATNHYILTADFYDRGGAYLAGDLGQEVAVLDSVQNWVYLSTAAFLIVKLLTVALILYTALYLNHHQIRFSVLFQLVTLSEFVFLIPALIKVLWFHLAFPGGTLEDWRHLYILSALSLAGTVSPNWYYPLQTLNVFEVGYWFLLAYGVSRLTSLGFDRSLKVVVSSYLPALLIWVGLVAFCSLMILPQNI